MRVFIGSTYQDLREHREAAIESLTQLSVEIEAMELWYAKPGDPLRVCLQYVADSDVYVCVVAHRYGSTLRMKSYTQREYEYARRKGKPCLVFVIDPTYPIPAMFVDRGIAAWQLHRFKKRLRTRHLVAEFTTPDDLAHQLVESVHDLIVKTERDVQALALDLSEFWRSLGRTWRGVQPPELRISYNPEDHPLYLLDRVDEELRGISDAHKWIEESHENLEEDLRNLLQRLGTSPAKLDDIDYMENPFVARDAEPLMLFPNRIYRIEALIAQARVRILKDEIDKGATDRMDELATAKQHLEAALSRIFID